MPEPNDSPKTWPPLGLPAGSVRALLTLLIVAVVVTNLGRGRDLDILWTETLLIAIAHYFTSRRFVSLAPDVVRRLEQEGVIDKETHPLFLPRHSIRTIIIGSFVGLAVYLHQEQRLIPSLPQFHQEGQPAFDAKAVSLLEIVFAYLVGVWVRGIAGWFSRRRERAPSRFWADAKAVIVLITLAAAAVPELLGQGQMLPVEVHKIALGLVLFYFGSR
jgi:hypothetical protein